MNLEQPFFTGKLFFGVQPDKFNDALAALLSSMTGNRGVFHSDNLITWSKSLGWLSDAEFVAAMNRHALTSIERGVVWRTVTLAWAARQALRVPGDFVECGCYKGTTARIICDIVDLSSRKFYLYDLFEGAEGISQHAMPEHGPKLFEQVTSRFSEMPNVIVTQGRVPESFSQVVPDQISLLHIDMNNVAAEIGALEALFDKVSPGGLIVLDDYGWIAYRAQQVAERAWFAERGYAILELPTGQGLVIK